MAHSYRFTNLSYKIRPCIEGRVICAGLPTCDCQQSVSGVYYQALIKTCSPQERSGQIEECRGIWGHADKRSRGQTSFWTVLPRKVGKDLVPYCYPAQSSSASHFSCPENFQTIICRFYFSEAEVIIFE